MKESKELVIDGKKYVTTLFSPTKGWPLFGRLGKYLGPSIATAFEAIGGNTSDIDVMNADVMKVGPKMFGSLFVNLPPEEIIPLLIDLFSTTQIQSENIIRPLVFDNDFKGGYVHAIKLAKEIVEFQYEDFWNAIKDITGDSPKVAVEQSIGRTNLI